MAVLVGYFADQLQSELLKIEGCQTRDAADVIAQATRGG
jgi:hypothetical protein